MFIARRWLISSHSWPTVIVSTNRAFQVLETSYCVPVDVEVEVLSDERLTEWLISADSSARADAWSRLVDVLGRDEASHRWLAAFAAFDAADT
jgi:hypothetical protein